MTNLAFAQTVILWRAERDWTQRELARRAEIPQSALSAIERGKRDVTLGTLRTLARALDVRPGLLADGTPPRAAEGQAPLSREAMERVADAVVRGEPLPDGRERRLAEALRSLVWHRLPSRQRRGKDARRGYRAAARAWLWLQSTYPPGVVKSMLQRISNRE